MIDAEVVSLGLFWQNPDFYIIFLVRDTIVCLQQNEHRILECSFPSTGAQLSVDVTTDLSLDGQFWCSLLLPGVGDGEEGEGGAYVRLQDELQTIPGRGDGDLYTPVFYSEGDVCAASFSEDGEWYRARIEKVIPEAVWNPDQ